MRDVELQDRIRKLEKDEKCTKVLVTRLKPKKHLRSMNNTVTIPHQLSNFSVTEEPKRVVTRNVQITVTSRKMKTEILRVYPHCGGIMHIHQNKIVHLQHLSILQRAHILLRTRCEQCGYTTGQQIPFKISNHRIKKPLMTLAAEYLSYGLTLTEVSRTLHIHPSTVRDIGRHRLKKCSLHLNQKPTVDI